MVLLGFLSVLAYVLRYHSDTIVALNSQYGILFTLSISVLIPWLTSERWVEYYRLKREHSQKLAKSPLTNWKESINHFTSLDVEPNKETFQYTPIPPETLTSLPYFDYLKKHLEQGHTHILESWAEVARKHGSVHEYKAEFMEKIRQSIFERSYLDDMGLKSFHYIQARRRIPYPLEFYCPDRFAESIFFHIKYYSEYASYPDTFLKERQANIDQEGKSHTVWDFVYDSDTLVRTLNKDDLHIFKGFFNGIATKPEFHKEMSQLQSQIEELEKLKERFERNVDELIWFIELGNNLKGECPFCPPNILSSLKDTFIGT